MEIPRISAAYIKCPKNDSKRFPRLFAHKPKKCRAQTTEMTKNNGYATVPPACRRQRRPKGRLPEKILKTRRIWPI
jgi:hypothetical protein